MAIEETRNSRLRTGVFILFLIAVLRLLHRDKLS